jgi:hypothetical protein
MNGCCLFRAHTQVPSQNMVLYYQTLIDDGDYQLFYEGLFASPFYYVDVVVPDLSVVAAPSTITGTINGVPVSGLGSTEYELSSLT